MTAGFIAVSQDLIKAFKSASLAGKYVLFRPAWVM